MDCFCLCLQTEGGMVFSSLYRSSVLGILPYLISAAGTNEPLDLKICAAH